MVFFCGCIVLFHMWHCVVSHVKFGTCPDYLRFFQEEYLGTGALEKFTLFVASVCLAVVCLVVEASCGSRFGSYRE